MGLMPKVLRALLCGKLNFENFDEHNLLESQWLSDTPVAGVTASLEALLSVFFLGSKAGEPRSAVLRCFCTDFPCGLPPESCPYNVCLPCNLSLTVCRRAANPKPHCQGCSYTALPQAGRHLTKPGEAMKWGIQLCLHHL